jgi:hypothetical protein
MRPCPHCAAPVDEWLLFCPSCQGEVSAMTERLSVGALKVAARAEASAPVFSRRPSRTNGLTSIWFFAGLGPYLGAVALGVQGSTPILAPISALHPFVLLSAYVLGVVPAVVAGVLYAVSSSFVAVWWKWLVVRSVSGAVLGCLCGTASMYAFRGLLLSRSAGPSSELWQVLLVGAIAGLGAGALAGHYLPVGDERAVEDESDASQETPPK